MSHWSDCKGSPSTLIFHFFSLSISSGYFALSFPFDPHAPPFLFVLYVAKEKEWENIQQQIQQLSYCQGCGGHRCRHGCGMLGEWAPPTTTTPAPGPAQPPRAHPQLPPPPPWTQLQQTSSPADPSHRTQEIHEVRPFQSRRQQLVDPHTSHPTSPVKDTELLLAPRFQLSVNTHFDCILTGVFSFKHALTVVFFF